MAKVLDCSKKYFAQGLQNNGILYIGLRKIKSKNCDLSIFCAKNPWFLDFCTQITWFGKFIPKNLNFFAQERCLVIQCTEFHYILCKVLERTYYRTPLTFWLISPDSIVVQKCTLHRWKPEKILNPVISVTFLYDKNSLR